MPLIRVLPDSLVNQIAAGEVVERPASVVKELVENSIDARARTVTVILEGGGRRRIEVVDDGCGMDADDALLAVERHATSKISSADDLTNISTLGFRGEALPSIAAVSRMTIETAVDDGAGTHVEIDAGTIRTVRPFARPRGTRILVEELFAHLPARRKFLRTEATELRHVLAVMLGTAFARPDLAFSVSHDRRLLLDLPAATDLAHRLGDLVGHDRARAAHPLVHQAGSIGVSGFLLPPKGPRELVLVVNGRPVRDRILVMAVNRALRGQGGNLEADAFVALRLPAEEVDINVHPAKTEVRFAEPGAVIAAVTGAVIAARTAMHGPAPIRRIVTVAPAGRELPPLSAWPGPRPSAGAPPPEATYESPPLQHLWVADSAVLTGRGAPEAPVAPPYGRFFGQYRDTYLVIEDAHGLLLVDQHAAHERVLFERLLAEREAPASQRLLTPELVELSPTLAGTAIEVAADLERLGLEIEVDSANTARVLAVPAGITGQPAGRLVEALLADLASGSVPGATVLDRSAASLACRAAIKKHRPLARAEAERLLADLAACREPHRCPHGRPILVRLAHEEIERRIGRR